MAGHHLGLDHLGGLATSLAFGAFGGSALPHGSSPLLAPALVVRLLGGRGARGGGADGAGERRGCTRRAMPLIGEAPADEGADPGRVAIADPARVDARAAPPVAVIGRGGAPRLSTSPSATYAAMVFLGDRFIIATSGRANPRRRRAWMWRAPEGAPRRRG